ncbi:MAG TPA: stalk domain-containing protein [Caldisericia bacterium]|nr:stalk domain-containing protein [Caldisericia bacterium]
MNRRVLMCVCLSVAIVAMVCPSVSSDSVAAQSSVVVKSYICDVKVGVKSFEFVSECFFETTRDLDSLSITFASQHLEGKVLSIDGKSFGFSNKSGGLDVKLTKPLKQGEHSFQLKYSGRTDINDPPNARLQIISTNNHFHCYNAWFSIIEGCGFDELVNFKVDIEIPPDWFLLGSYVDEKYRDKPNPTGKYSIELQKDNVYSMKLIGGDYEVYKEDIGTGHLRVYTFKGEGSDSVMVAKLTKKAMDFYSEYYDHPCDEDYYICSQTGRRGNGQGLDGGYTIDSPYMSSEFYAPDFFAHETAHVSWFGGTGIRGERVDPCERFFSEAFAEFSSLLFCEEALSGDESFNKLGELREQFLLYSPIGALTDASSTWNNTIIYTKGALVLWALRNYVGKDVFKQAMQDMFDEYATLEGENIRRISFRGFKGIIERNYGDSIDLFWDVFFDSGKLVDPQITIENTMWEGQGISTLNIKNRGWEDFPINVDVYYIDGSRETFTFTGDELNQRLNKMPVGYELVEYHSIIPRKDTLWHTLGTSTVASALNWNTPIVLIDKNEDQEKHERATLWQEKYGCQISHDLVDKLPETPVILIGADAQIKYLADVIDNIPVCCRGDYLKWHNKKIQGSYKTLGLFPNPEFPNTPIILDSMIGELPDDLNFAVSFVRDDGRHNLSYVSNKIGELAAPDSSRLFSFVCTDSIPIKQCMANLCVNFNAPGFISYDGFNPNDFTVGKTTIDVGTDNTSFNLALKFTNGESNLSFGQNDEYLSEVWNIEYKYTGTTKEYNGPSDVEMPAATESDYFTAKWSGQTQYVCCMDDTCETDWKTGSKLTFTNLEDGKHEFKILFVKDGLLSPLIEKTIYTGAVKPSLEFTDGYALYKNGVVTVHGKTDPGCTVEPGAKVSEDGSFVVEYAASEAPSVLEVISTSPEGMVEKKSISVVKYLKLIMRLGKSEVSDHEGNSWSLDVPPQLVGGSTYVPMRFIGERLGARVEWVASERKVLYYLGLSVVEIWIGKDVAKVNGVEQKMPGAPVIVSGSTLVPVRFVSEALGADVAWFGDEKRIEIEYPKVE